MLRAMTDKTGAARKTAYGRGARKLYATQEDHHIIFRTLLDKFYENLDPDDAAELTAHLARRGSPTGNVIENLQGLDIDLHDSKMPGSLHQWARNMGIDGQTFPDLTGLDFDARTTAIDEWLNLIEQPLLDRTATTLSRQDYRRYGTKGLPNPTKGFKDRPNGITKKDWLEYLTNQRENVKARANLLDKYPILAEDLDSPNIRPELKARYQKALDLVPEEDLNKFKSLKPQITELGGRLGGEPVLLRKKISPVIQNAVDTTKKILNAVPTPVKKLAGKATKYGLYGAGLYFASGQRELRAAEYEENPNMGNLVQKTIAQGQEQIERLDVATGGASGAVTWIPNLAGDVIDSAIETTQDPNYIRGEMRGSQWGGDIQGALDIINKIKEKELSEEEKKKNREHVDSIPNLPGFL